jgi:hypothetical protein
MLPEHRNRKGAPVLGDSVPAPGKRAEPASEDQYRVSRVLPESGPILYPIWQRLPRPRFFPEDPRLDRLLASNYDPTLDGFKLTLRRCEARDLRKGIFGPKGSRIVPKFSGDLNTYNRKMEFDLPTVGGLASPTARPSTTGKPERWMRTSSRRERPRGLAAPRTEPRWRLSPRLDAMAGCNRPASPSATP